MSGWYPDDYYADEWIYDEYWPDFGGLTPPWINTMCGVDNANIAAISGVPIGNIEAVNGVPP